MIFILRLHGKKKQLDAYLNCMTGTPTCKNHLGSTIKWVATKNTNHTIIIIINYSIILMLSVNFISFIKTADVNV